MREICEYEESFKEFCHKLFFQLLSSSFTTTVTSASSYAATSTVKSDTEEDVESELTTDMDSRLGTSVSTATQASKKKGPSSFDLDSSHYMGIDAVKKLRMHYNVNKVCQIVKEARPTKSPDLH